MKKVSPYLAALAAGALLLAGCSAATETPTSGGSADICGSSEEAQIVFSNSVTASTTEAVWQTMVDRFTELCPNVTVEMLTPPTADRDAYLKQLLASGNFPDVHYSLQPDLFKDQLQPFDLDDPDLAKVRNLDAMIQDGELYQIGVSVTPWNVIFYNKDLFAEAGIDSVPTTREEFVEDLELLKESGTTPLITAGEWVTGLTFTILFPIFAENQCWYADRHEGTVSFTDDNWVDYAEEFKSWIDEGYFNEGPLGIGYTQLQQLFYEGKAAMYPMGGWFAGEAAPDFPAGVFPMPTADGAGPLDGSIGSVGFTVSNSSKFPEVALAFAKFMALDPENHRDLLATNGGLSNLDLGESALEPERTELNTELQAIVDAAPSFNTAFNGQGDCSLVPGTQEEIVTQMQAIISGTPPKDALKAIDDFWDRGAQG